MAINKRISLLALTILVTLLATALIAALTFGGGAKRTVASRSAAAFGEALRKGEPVTQGSHGHGALPPAGTDQPAHGEGGGAEISKHGHAEQGTPGMAGHGAPASQASGDPHAAHRMTAQADRRGRAGRADQPQEGTRRHKGLQHGSSAAADVPSGATPGGPFIAPPGPKAIEASPGQAAATLQPDPLDQPPDTSLEEAKRAAEVVRQMGAGHGMQHGTGSYRQLDAGRDTSPAASPTPDPPLREPTHPPHHSGGNEASR